MGKLQELADGDIHAFIAHSALVGPGKKRYPVPAAPKLSHEI
jgi:hypothetical protein